MNKPSATGLLPVGAAPERCIYVTPDRKLAGGRDRDLAEVRYAAPETMEGAGVRDECR